MAENGIDQEVIGVAFDGTGYGTDGTVWGGEFLTVTPRGFKRAGHLKAVKLFGSDESVRQGWKTAACYLHQAGINIRNGDARTELIAAALDAGINTVLSSSMGRLFDAVSSMLGICSYSDYEGQCAVELENAAARYEASGRPVPEPLVLDFSGDRESIAADMLPCIRSLYAEVERGGDTELLAMRFHITITKLILEMCKKIRENCSINTVVLSGGVFQNRILLINTVPALEKAGFAVYTNRLVPPGDGGISLGQAFIISR
jgi:hydrogenase maturation protein HypF